MTSYFFARRRQNIAHKWSYFPILLTSPTAPCIISKLLTLESIEHLPRYKNSCAVFSGSLCIGILYFNETLVHLRVVVVRERRHLFLTPPTACECAQTG